MPNISTGGVSLRGGYSRPTLSKISQAQADIYKLHSSFKELAPNVWAVTMRPFRGGRIYTTKVMVKKGAEYITYEVPTDKNGVIPDVIMAERLMDIESGDRQGNMRNVLVDIGVEASRNVSPSDLANTYEWYLFPNESDVKEVDDSKSKIINILAKEDAKHPPKALITGGTMAQREKIAYDLTHNFTVKERRIIANCLIQIGHPGRNAAGCFQGHTDSSGKPLGVPKIIIGSEYVRNSDVIIHECVHALRQFDPERDARLKAVKSYWGRDADLEESLTEAETVTRQKPFSKHESPAGYYHYVKVPDKTDKDLIISDRVTIVDKPHNDPQSGLKGKRAQKTLLLKYPATYISHMKMKGDVETIDSYYQINNSNALGTNRKTITHVQVYAPKANNQTAKALDAEISSSPGTTIKWDDGKKRILSDRPVRIKSRLARITPKRPRIGR